MKTKLQTMMQCESRKLWKRIRAIRERKEKMIWCEGEDQDDTIVGEVALRCLGVTIQSGR